MIEMGLILLVIFVVVGTLGRKAASSKPNPQPRSPGWFERFMNE